MRVLGFTFGVSLLTGLLFGIAPALRASRTGVGPALNAAARTVSAAGGRSARFLPKTLITAQVTLSLVLLAGAGLFVRTLQNLQSQDFGFNRSNVLLAQFNAKFAGYKPEQVNGLHQRILDRIVALPGVRSAALSGAPAINFGRWNSPIFVQGQTPPPDRSLSTNINRVSAGYFETVGIPLLRGRVIGLQDTATSTKVVVVNQSMADYFFPKGDAIGHQFTIADPGVPGAWQIVGIVRDAKYFGAREEPQRMIYLPLAQMTGDDSFAYWLQVRTDGDPGNLASSVRTAWNDVDPNLPQLEMKTIAEHLSLFTDDERLISQLLTIFSLLALTLACIGLYGVMTYNVVRRTGEIGIRIALGARRGRILGLVAGQAVALAAAGVAVATPIALGLGHALKSQLYHVSPDDAALLAAVAALAITVALAASLIPARRATRVDPMEALRTE
jgi:predicted permease